MSLREEDDDDALDESEWPEGSGSADRDSADTETCPHCGKPVHEEAEVCPYCRNYISREDAPTRKPLWFVIAVLICLAAILLKWVF